MKQYFITGTDTNIGKTYISVGLLKAFAKQGLSTIGIKPIASGASYIDGRLCNQDALDLLAAATVKKSYDDINPIVFAEPIAPHLAALSMGVEITLRDMINKITPVLRMPCDIQIIEGAGGWYLPLNQTETMIDFVSYFQLPVILVVGIKLGAINHALLTYQSIKQSGAQIAGWVANMCDDSVVNPNDIVAAIKECLLCHYLGQVPYGAKAEDYLDIDLLFCSDAA